MRPLRLPFRPQHYGLFTAVHTHSSFWVHQIYRPSALSTATTIVADGHRHTLGSGYSCFFFLILENTGYDISHFEPKPNSLLSSYISIICAVILPLRYATSYHYHALESPDTPRRRCLRNVMLASCSGVEVIFSSFVISVHLRTNDYFYLQPPKRIIFLDLAQYPHYRISRIDYS